MNSRAMHLANRRRPFDVQTGSLIPLEGAILTRTAIRALWNPRDRNAVSFCGLRDVGLCVDRRSDGDSYRVGGMQHGSTH